MWLLVEVADREPQLPKFKLAFFSPDLNENAIYTNLNHPLFGEEP